MKLISPISGVIEQTEGRFGLKERLRVEFKANEPFELPDNIATEYLKVNPAVYQKFTGQKPAPIVEKPIVEDKPLVAKSNAELEKEKAEELTLMELAKTNPEEVFKKADELGIKYAFNISPEKLAGRISESIKAN